MSAELLARVRTEIDARLDELRPTLAEYEQLLNAYETLEAAPKPAPPPAARAAAGRRRGPRGSAAGALRRAASGPAKRAASGPAKRAASGPAKRAPSGPAKRAASGPAKRAASGPRGAAQQAIVAALEHGSHTVAELVLVTARPAREIRDSARSLQRAGTITATKRGGRAAYALSSPASA
jgi:hypothetical protein